ncbi:MAG: dTDP-4-dehydrorhamnose 3,5-epimerase [bacterium]|nr:dTDP-4-dehydrorhamnose 3,5-epimerase [bacterium]
MDIEKTKFDGVYLLTPQIYEDERGSFRESFNREKFAKATGVNPDFIQDNVSCSTRGVLRGLHYQLPPHSQAKLVSVLQGHVWDFIVDLRPDSKTFTQHGVFDLTERNNKQLYIPKGFAHGFFCQGDCIMSYKVEGKYNPKVERTLRWDEPQFGFKHYTTWNEDYVVQSEKDKVGITMKECVAEIKSLYTDSKQLSITDGI